MTDAVISQIPELAEDEYDDETEENAPEIEDDIHIRQDFEADDAGGDTTWVYFRDLGRFNILTREQEIAVARRIETHKKSIKEIVFSSNIS